jgi:hypothetical protein
VSIGETGGSSKDVVYGVIVVSKNKLPRKIISSMQQIM